MKTKLSLVALSIAILCSCTTQKPEAKYIFLFIGDGMGASQVALTESYLSHLDGKLGGSQLQLSQFPYYGMCTTYSADALITDSAASGTAIATGHKTYNGRIGVDTLGNPINSIAHILKKEYNYQVGIFSSVPLNHATPATFYAHTISRKKYFDITSQIPESGFEFIGGSGFLSFSGPKKDKDSEKLLESEGYEVVFGQAEFDATKSSKIVMVSNGRKESKNKVANYEDQEDKLVPLSQMMKNCLSLFDESKPFFVMCEGGDIDWTSHGNKTMSTINAMLAMDEAVKVAYEFYLKHPKETLILVTADHQTGGVSLGSYGSNYNVYWDEIISEYEKAGKDDNFANTEERVEFNKKHGIGWTSFDHNGDPVPIYAIGVGAEKFCGRMDNTDIIKKILPHLF